ncbi:LysR family transcriptional regulator [Stappia sp. MMSF_3263]|uniref:LysR family transcriptional regulator n=1 Tax=Stappia sp. MMSF_3263 TaxID=3046693 RepID=UPI00273F9F99|nr:LysR family transcriptional regulator [Stappia sp. MMSF_3263]
MYNLNDLRFFVQAVDCGGFAAAGRLTGAPKSTVAKRVAELERQLGARLLQRSSRSFHLTDLGRDVYEHARAAVIEAEAAEQAVKRRLAEPSGLVRLTTSVPVARFHLAPRLAGIMQRHPKIELRLNVSDRFVDLLHEGFDIAVRSHAGPLPDSGLVQRRMGVETVILAASPEFLARAGTPRTPAELESFETIGTGSDAPWPLTHESGEQASLVPRMRLSLDEAGMLLAAAEAGLGVTCLPETVAQTALAEGRLVRLLPGWRAGTITTTILTPHRRGVLPSVRAVVEALLEA